MTISGLNNIYGNRIYENISAAKSREKAGKENDSPTLTADETTGQKTDSIEISPEGLLAAELEKESQEAADSEALEEEIQEAADPDSTEENGATDIAAENSEGSSGKVAVNEGKRARQIAAAKNQAQVQQVLALLRKDLSDCKAGKQKGWCDDSEIAKVEALISRAQARMSQVPQKSDEDDQGGLDAFAMASLM